MRGEVGGGGQVFYTGMGSNTRNSQVGTVCCCCCIDYSVLMYRDDILTIGCEEMLLS